MTTAKSRLTLVTAPTSGWCDPVTGVCHIDTAEEPATERSPAEEPATERSPAEELAADQSAGSAADHD